MSTEYYPYPVYYPQTPQSGTPGDPMAQGAHYGGVPPMGAGYGPYYAPPYPPGPASAYQAQSSGSFLNFSNDRFLRGLLIGAAATYILTNESVQRTAIKGVVKAWSMLQGGIEEVKERFQDAEAELQAAETAQEDEV